MTKEDMEELEALGTEKIRLLRQRAKAKGVSLENIECLSCCAVHSPRPDQFRLHYLGLSKRGALVLFNHSKEDIAYQLAEWTMTQGDTANMCRCVRLLLILRYGKHGGWAAVIEEDFQWVSKSLKERILHIAAKKGLKRLYHNQNFLDWAKENVSKKNQKDRRHLEYGLARWLIQRHPLTKELLSC